MPKLKNRPSGISKGFSDSEKRYQGTETEISYILPFNQLNGSEDKMAKLPTEEALEIAKQTRGRLLGENASTAKVLYGCLTVATLLGDKESSWILNELSGYRDKTIEVPHYRIRRDARNNGIFRIRDPISRLEHYAYTNQTINIWADDDANRSIASDDCLIIISDINTMCLIYLTNKIRELQYGGLIQSIVDDTRRTVEEKLEKISKDALNELQSVYNLLSTGSSDTDWSHATQSCRRALKFTADAVFQASKLTRKGSDGKEHELKDDDFINRLCAFIEDKKGSKLTVSELSYFGSYLRGINEIDSKGVHDKVSRNQAEQIAVHTYLILNEVLSLKSEV
jgi:hypothetical protein